MKQRKSDPQDALDYPKIDKDRWVIWSGNEHLWPDARRAVYYLSDLRDIMKGYALWTPLPEDALSFATEREAWGFLLEQEGLRTTSYGDVRITTVAAMIAERFPTGAAAALPFTLSDWQFGDRATGAPEHVTGRITLRADCVDLEVADGRSIKIELQDGLLRAMAYESEAAKGKDTPVIIAIPPVGDITVDRDGYDAEDRYHPDDPGM